MYYHNRTFFTNSREYYEAVLKHNIMNEYSDRMTEFYGKYSAADETGDSLIFNLSDNWTFDPAFAEQLTKELSYNDRYIYSNTDSGVKNDQNMGENGVENDQTPTKTTYKSLKKVKFEYIYGKFYHQAYTFDKVYVLKNDSTDRYEYVRYSCPETSAYIDIEKDSEVLYFGYKDRDKKIKGRAKMLLEWYLAKMKPKNLLLQALLTKPDKNTNKMCHYYEKIGFKFTGYTEEATNLSMWAANYIFNAGR